MKKTIVLIMFLACLLPLLTACKKTEGQMGISYDPIVCRFSYSGSWGSRGIEFTVYADNRIRSASLEKDDVTGEPVCYIFSPITEEQKQRIIDRIREYEVWNIDIDSETIVFDAVIEYLDLFDADGEEVCGVYCYNTDRTRIDEIHKIGKLIADMVPAKIKEEVRGYS